MPNPRKVKANNPIQPNTSKNAHPNSARFARARDIVSSDLRRNSPSVAGKQSRIESNTRNVIQCSNNAPKKMRARKRALKTR